MYCTLSVSLHWNAGFMRTRVLVHFYSLLYSLCLYCSVQLPHHVRLFVTPLTATRQASPSITNSQSLLKLMSIESVMPSSHFILCCPLLLQPSVFPNIKVFSSESVLRIRWRSIGSIGASASVLLMNIQDWSPLGWPLGSPLGWLDLLAVQGTLKSLLQHHSSKASILWLIYSSCHIHSWLLEKP